MTNKDGIDRLMDQGRIRGESRMIPEGTDAAAVTKDVGEDVIRKVLDYIEQTGTSRREIAKNINIAGSTLGQVLNRSYGGNWQEIILDLDRWLDDRQRADKMEQRGTFVWTKVATDVRDVAELVIGTRSIGLVYGPTTSGIGKTMALEALHREKAASILVTVEKVNATVAGLLRAIARAMRVSQDGGQERVYQRVKQALAGTQRLLIIDQVHNLCRSTDDKPFFVLCDLWDATRAPQLWCGTSDIVAYLDRGQSRGRETLAQIRRRIVFRKDLMQRTRSKGDGGRGEPLFTVQEIREIFKRNKMRLAPDAAHYLTRLACLPDAGGLGAADNLVLAATLANDGRGAVLTAGMLREMHEMMVNTRAFTALEAQMDEDALPIAQAG